MDKEKQNIKVVLLNLALDKGAKVEGIITEHKVKYNSVTYQTDRNSLNLNRLGINPPILFFQFLEIRARDKKKYWKTNTFK